LLQHQQLVYESSLKLIFNFFSFSLVVIGAACERGRIWPATVFVFVWCTLVYNVVACWIWSPNGWASVLGALDYAGGIPVHMIAGTSALVYSLVLGKRLPVTHTEQGRPHNINNVFIGTVLSWFGWFGFNGGSGLLISSRAALACVVTNLAACTGGFTWCMLDYFLLKPKYKFTLFGFCMGAMAGLVCITPGSGFVGAPASLVFGIGGSACVYFSRQIKVYFKIDDAFDIFAQHGIGGLVGSILTGIFAQKYIPALDQAVIPGGWLDGNWIQVGYQLAFASKGEIRYCERMNSDLKIF
jgi:Amt family ammonium transporter